MNWLTPLCQEIMKFRDLPREHRDTLILWTAELSGICDTHVKYAPPPIFYADDSWCRVGWWLVASERLLTVSIERDLVPSLNLKHLGQEIVVPKPTHEQLKRAVEAFFEVPTHA